MHDLRKDLTSPRIIILILLFALTFSFRFINLGYSEFQDDEKKAIIRPKNGQNVIDFFMQQRKGPMQFFVTAVPLALNGNDRTDEFFIRLPFALISSFSVIALYLLLIRVTKSTLGSFFASCLFALDGFFVGFGRIAQYQNLNLLFSFLSLLMYSLVDIKSKKFTDVANIGALFWCFSLLSHWDAIYYLPIIVFFVFRILLSKELENKIKVKFVVTQLLTVSIVLLPFMIPYLLSQADNSSNLTYLGRRVGIGQQDLAKHFTIFSMYNPFNTVWVYAGMALIGILNIRKTWIHYIWFGIAFSLIYFFMSKPGTHIYNYLIPLYFIIAFGLAVVKTNYLKILVALLVLPFLVWQGYQSYRLFIDNQPEYPWRTKTIYAFMIADEYKGNDVLTFGFPHNRNLKYIGDMIRKDDEVCRYYISNEGKEITGIYMDGVKYKSETTKTCYYLIKVKDGFIFNRDNTRYPEEIGRKPIYSYYKDNEKLVDVYKIDRRPNASL